VGANPTATATDTVVNGVATTFMRSDAAPPVQKGSASVFGILKVDGSSITASGGVISAAGGSSGAMTLISTLTASGSGSLAWTGLTAAKHFRLVGRFLIPATNATALELQVGTGAGPTYLTANYHFARKVEADASSSADDGGTALGYMPTSYGPELNTGTVGSSFVMDIITDNANQVMFIGQAYGRTTSPGDVFVSLGGRVATSAAITAIKVFESTGNIATGEASLYTIAT
jgi:hypothetical protein